MATGTSCRASWRRSSRFCGPLFGSRLPRSKDGGIFGHRLYASKICVPSSAARDPYLYPNAKTPSDTHRLYRAKYKRGDARKWNRYNLTAWESRGATRAMTAHGRRLANSEGAVGYSSLESSQKGNLSFLRPQQVRISFHSRCNYAKDCCNI